LSIFDAIILGILQGLTEFLPVSSSGHLILVEELLHISHDHGIAFEVFLHFGTLLSVVLMFWKEIKSIVFSFIGGLLKPSSIKHLFKNDDYFRLAVFIIIGCIPAGLVGVLFEHQIEILFNDPKFVSVMLLITGLILFLTKFANPKDDSKVGLPSTIVIGIAQAIAIIPGISRSGMTISSALFSGVSRQNSAKFSFLLALPVIFGATILKTQELFRSPITSTQLIPLVVGTIIAAVFGYIAIRLVLGLLQKRRFSWFAYYCFLVGIVGILFIGQ
jgi:undecaprenyl-diphosphatase